MKSTLFKINLKSILFKCTKLLSVRNYQIIIIIN